MTKRMLVIAMTAAIVLPSMGLAQPPAGRHMREKRHGTEIEARMHTMKIWKLTEELDLSEEQAARFFPIMNELENQLEEIHQERRQTLEKLGDLVWKADADAGKINEQLDQLEVLAQKQIELRKQFRKDVSDVLDPAQMGKMVLFNHQFPAVVRDMIQEFEDRQVPRSPPGRRDNRW